MSEEPHIEIIRPPDQLGEQWRAERDRQADESRRRYHDRLVAALAAVDRSHSSAAGLADAVFDALFDGAGVESGGRCSCSCHPHLPQSDLHDYGFDCPCQQTVEQRRERFDAWMAEMDKYWDSPEGRAVTEQRAREETTLQEWLDGTRDVIVTNHGGMAPEQWNGSVDGHSFYFRERHGQWRIELDLQPSGRRYLAWVAGDLDDEASYEARDIEEGEIIAEGNTAVDGYGVTPVERARFITDTIRAHLGRMSCDVHRRELDDLEMLCGRKLNWCPACGLRLYAGQPTPW